MKTITIIAGYCGSISAIIAFVVLIVKPLRNKFIMWVNKTSDRDNIHQKIDNLTTLMETQIEQNKEIQIELEQQRMALQAVLRNAILNIYNSCTKKGYMTLYEKSNLSKLYEQYVSLDGNSFVKECVEQLYELPVKDN